jgi:GrpB-like predicted nucleotidyltransferase (UPF0157 family)
VKLYRACATEYLPALRKARHNMPMEVIVLPHDPAWPELFRTESALILNALGPNGIAEHHIGSTAIPAAVAKPIIDILVVVADIGAVDARNADVIGLGYEAMGEFGIPGRRCFRKENDAGKRTHHVHVYQAGRAKGPPMIVRGVACGRKDCGVVGDCGTVGRTAGAVNTVIMGGSFLLFCLADPE